MIHDLPPIEQWWPTLPMEFKHRILAHPTAPLDADVIVAIRGVAITPDGYDIIRLSPGELAFVRDQIEPVD